jgi:26S proteasome regulatory subunit N6
VSEFDFPDRIIPTCLQLASLLQQQKQPSQALEIVDKLLVELKKLDDKQMLTETHLTEARIYHSLQNIPKGELLVVLSEVLEEL